MPKSDKRKIILGMSRFCSKSNLFFAFLASWRWLLVSSFALDNCNTSPSQFPNPSPLALSEADNLSKFTWVFFCRWSIRATARRPEDNWLFTSKMQLLHRNIILSLKGLLQICSSCKELLSNHLKDFYKAISGPQTHPCKLIFGDQSWSSVRSIKLVRSGKSSKYSSSSTLYVSDILYCFLIYILYFVFIYFIFFCSGKSSKYSSSPTFV